MAAQSQSWDLGPGLSALSTEPPDAFPRALLWAARHTCPSCLRVQGTLPGGLHPLWFPGEARGRELTYLKSHTQPPSPDGRPGVDMAPGNLLSSWARMNLDHSLPKGSRARCECTHICH